MVDPFIQRAGWDGFSDRSIEDGQTGAKEGIKNKEGSLTWMEIYHLIMVNYPAYTIESIEEGLTKRQVVKLLELATEKDTGYRLLMKIEQCQERIAKVTFPKPVKVSLPDSEQETELLSMIRGFSL